MLSFDLVHVQPQLSSSQESERLLSSREPIHEIYVESEGIELPVFTIPGRIHDLFLDRIFAQTDLLVCY